MSYIIGCDMGGTFTDVIVIDEKGITTSGKALSTPPDFIEGINKALDDVAESLGKTVNELMSQTNLFNLGTTIATNIIINRSGVKTGLITTVGNEDVHHIARGGLSKWMGLPPEEIREAYRTKKVEPLVPKSLVRGVTERIDWKGSVVCPLNVEEAKQAVKSLVDEGVESIAVCLLWSFSNPVHENEIKKILEAYPQVYAAISHELSPTLGEYARSNTAIIDGYVGPVVKKFLSTVSEILTNRGLKVPLLQMQANGGCVYGYEAKPYATFQSGPVAGVIGSKYLGESMGYKNIVTTDVGGTSFDVSVIPNASLVYAREPIVDRFLVSFPIVDVVSIGAGGGSIAWVDPSTHLLRVGPKSAGALPGPACYGFGGIEPTVTDADVVLGYLNPDYFLGGRMKLYPENAHEAIKRLATQLGLSITRTAAGIYEIANAHMADLVRSKIVELGYDPREFIIFAYGGNGPMHAAFYAAEAGIAEVIVPVAASTYSALGLAISDILHSHSLYQANPMPMDPDKLNANFETLERLVNEELSRDGIKEEDRIINYMLDMKWGSQYYTIRMPIERKKYDTKGIEALCTQFDELYEKLYGKGSAYVESGRVVMSFGVNGIGKTTKPLLSVQEVKTADSSKALKGERSVFFKTYNEYRPTNIYDFTKLEAGNFVSGPAIIEAPQTTIVIPPERGATVDKYNNLVIK